MRFATIAVCVLVSCSTVFAADTLEDVKKKITERNNKHNSIQYKMKMTSDISQDGMVMKTTSDAIVKYMKHDEKLMSHMDMTSNMTYKIAGTEQTTVTKGLTVVDGEYMWSVSEMQGQKYATKMKIPKEQKSIDPSVGWEGYELKLLPDAKIDGLTCWVIEMTPTLEQIKAQLGKSVASYDQDTGLMVSNIGYDSAGKEISKVTVTDIKVNEKMDPKIFKFTPPEGVTVQDMTNSQGMPQG
jgi:outer membrane lipoprotein-sorting protein